LEVVVEEEQLLLALEGLLIVLQLLPEKSKNHNPKG